MRKTYPEIHFFRILACIMVIIIHTTATPVVTLTPNSPPQLLFTLLNRFSKPSVPMFVFMSGFLLNTLYIGKPLKWLSFWKKRLPKLFMPYFIWASLYFIIYATQGYYPVDLKFYLKGLLQGSFIYHLYFMVIIIQFYLAYPIFHWLQSKVGTEKLFLLTLMVQFLFIFIPLPLQDRIMPTYLSYFTLGMLLNTNAKPSQKSPSYYMIAFGIMGSVYTAEFIQSTNNGVYINARLATVIYILFSLIACYTLLMTLKSLGRLYQDIAPEVNFLSQSTLTLYYAHPLVLILLNLVLDKLGIASISLRALIAFLGIFIILIPILLIIEYFKPKLAFVNKP